MKTNPFHEEGIPELYEIAKEITLGAGMPYTDPRTLQTTLPTQEPRLGPTPEQDKELDQRREKAINNIIKSVKKEEKKKPPCARCGKAKKTAKHHWPLSSSRLVPLCDHCYAVTKKQRKRAAKFF
jgi:hypothetical protein